MKISRNSCHKKHAAATWDVERCHVLVEQN